MRYEERTRKEFAVLCDRCRERGPWAPFEEMAQNDARARGWQVTKYVALCPKCAGQEEEER